MNERQKPFYLQYFFSGIYQIHKTMSAFKKFLYFSLNELNILISDGKLNTNPGAIMTGVLL